jgi:ribosomal protein S18 acetylase RimI-like enzyme
VKEPIRLVRDLSLPIGEVRWPAGIGLQPFGASLAPKAHALLRDCYENGYGSVPVDFDAWWAKTRHDSEFDAGLCFCAVQNAQLVGFALCWTSAFVKDIGVASRVQRQGIGEALLRTAFDAFKRRGASTVALKVQPDNQTARRLYGKLGFRES